MYGESFDPVMKAAALADKFDKLAAENPELIPMAIDKWLKMAEFTNGKIQSVQLTGDADNPVVLTKIGSKMPEFEAAKIYRDTLKAPH